MPRRHLLIFLHAKQSLRTQITSAVRTCSRGLRVRTCNADRNRTGKRNRGWVPDAHRRGWLCCRKFRLCRYVHGAAYSGESVARERGTQEASAQQHPHSDQDTGGIKTETKTDRWSCVHPNVPHRPPHTPSLSTGRPQSVARPKFEHRKASKRQRQRQQRSNKDQHTDQFQNSTCET